jgi:hypothetical protein
MSEMSRINSGEDEARNEHGAARLKELAALSFWSPFKEARFRSFD